jgi:hypothetical protein
MKFRIEPRGGHLLAELHDRENAADMREFVLAVTRACREHDCLRILVSVRSSRPMFKTEDYGLSGVVRGYLNEVVSPSCRIALLGDSSELHHAHEYVELVARQQHLNVKAFRDASAAAQWLEAAADIPGDSSIALDSSSSSAIRPD